MHLDGLVADREPASLGIAGIVTATGIVGRSLPVGDDALKARIECEVLGEMRLDIHTHVVAPVVEIVNVSLLAEVAQ